MRALLSVADGGGIDIAAIARALQDLGVEVIASEVTRTQLGSAGIETGAIVGSDRPGSRDRRLARDVSPVGLRRHPRPSARPGRPERAGRPAATAPSTSSSSACGAFVPQVGDRIAAIDEAVEMIDVAGLSLLGAAARNFGGVAVVCDPADQGPLLDELRDTGRVSAETRRRLAARAFAVAAAYQGEVAAYLEHIGGQRFPEQLSIVLRKERDLAYGENPHQSAALYRETGGRARSLADAEQAQGPRPTYNDLIDLDAGYRMASDFASPTCAIVKQRNPVGLASHDDLREAYRRALSGDPVTAYGAVVALNREVDEALARELVLNPFEGVVAAGVSEGARAILAERPELAVLDVPSGPSNGASEHGIAGLDFHRVSGGLLVETRDTLDIDHAQLNVVTKRRPTLEELTDMMFAWRAVRHITSLAVVVAKAATLVGVGAGQSSRLTATEIALHRAADRAPRSVLASDAYFPFGDAIALAAERGVTAIIQPGGSVRDEMAIEIADRHHLAMVFTGRRHFRH